MLATEAGVRPTGPAGPALLEADGLGPGCPESSSDDRGPVEFDPAGPLAPGLIAAGREIAPVSGSVAAATVLPGPAEGHDRSRPLAETAPNPGSVAAAVLPGPAAGDDRSRPLVETAPNPGPVAAATVLPGPAAGHDRSRPVTNDITRPLQSRIAGAAIPLLFSRDFNGAMTPAALNSQGERHSSPFAAGLAGESGKDNILTSGHDSLSALEVARRVMENDYPASAVAGSLNRPQSGRPARSGFPLQPLPAGTGHLAGPFPPPTVAGSSAGVTLLSGVQPADGARPALVPGNVPSGHGPAPGQRNQIDAAVFQAAGDSPARRLGTPPTPVPTVAGLESRPAGPFEQAPRPAGEEPPGPAGRELTTVLPAAAALSGNGPRPGPGPAHPPLHPNHGLTGPDRRIIDQLVNRVIFSRSNQGTSLVLTLHPRELGEVRIELVADKDGLQAHLYSRNQQVQDVLERHLPRLREAFEQQGLKIHDLQVGGDARRDADTGSRPDQGPSYYSRPGVAPAVAAANRAEPDRPVEPFPVATGWSGVSGFSLRI
ncbi:MAG: flagellar hook-length control protein FliK [Desulfobacterales bacterium]|nr:flagellar hook-length control protein FliK [Desulfobacterales bacterium]